MPIYEYQCQACSHEFEKLLKISDAALVDCPECGKPELKKKISAAGFRLSGGGWYETDFKSGNKKNLAGEKDTGTQASDKAKDSSTGDKKTEKKTEKASTTSNSSSATK